MRKLISFSFVCAVFLASPLSLAADDAAGPTRIPTVTRWVKLFVDKESALASAMGAGDEAALDKILADDFELRTGANPGTPTPRADFIRQARIGGGPSFSIEQMAVHDLGEHAVVSFLQLSSSGGTRQPSGDIFVVDVWKRAGDEWRLAVRYASRGGDPRLMVPGASLESPNIPKKY